MIGCHSEQHFALLCFRLDGLLARKSGCLSMLFDQPALHLSTASVRILISGVGVGTVMNLPAHDQLQDNFSKAILDASAVIICLGIPGGWDLEPQGFVSFVRCLDSSVGLRPGSGMIESERDLLTAHCHTDIASLFAKPGLVAGLGQGKEEVVQDPQPSPFEWAIEKGFAVTEPVRSIAGF
jgi:hypothetical protein